MMYRKYFLREIFFELLSIVMIVDTQMHIVFQEASAPKPAPEVVFVPINMALGTVKRWCPNPVVMIAGCGVVQRAIAFPPTPAPLASLLSSRRGTLRCPRGGAVTHEEGGSVMTNTHAGIVSVFLTAGPGEVSKRMSLAPMPVLL